MVVSRRIVRAIIGTQRKLLHSYPASIAMSKEKTIKIDQWNINYLKIGQGPNHILCLPGTLGTIWTDFKLQIEEFDKNRFTLVVWDPPGYGKSRPPLRTFKTDLYETDADHAYELMKALQIPKYSILGWSGGGISGLFHAAKYPDAMQRLVVWGSPSFLFPHDVDCFRRVRDLDSWSDQMKQPFLEVYGQELLSYYTTQWVDTIEAIFTEKKGNICAHLLERIKCPTFVLVGEKDSLIDPAHAFYLKENIADVRLHVYPEGKHNLHLNYGNDFNTRVQDFLQQPLSPKIL